VGAANAPHRKAHKDGSRKRPKDLTDVCDMMPVQEVVKAIKKDEERQQSEPQAADVRPPQRNLLTVGKSRYSVRDQPLQHECVITRPHALANPFKMGRSGKEEHLRDVVCVAHKMRTQKLVDANLDYLRNGQGVPIARGRTGENVLKSEEFKRQSIETHVKKKKASFKGVRGEEPVRKWHKEAEQYIREVYDSYIWTYDEPEKEQEWISELRALVVRTRAGWHTHLLCACRERHQAQPECHGDALPPHNWSAALHPAKTALTAGVGEHFRASGPSPSLESMELVSIESS